ncbi:MAG: tetratricopeptide repeat protein [Bacteroidetes bacterium]|nr:tetratricopeptide repeat protein [Bacteroidota bacterium]
MKKILIFAMMVLLISCNSKKKAAERNDLNDEIATQKKEFENSFESGRIDFQAGKLLTEKYELFVSEFPEDELSPQYLIELGNLYTGILADTEKAVQSYLLILKNYPESEYVPISYFLLGDLYKERLGDLVNAEKYYKLLIEKYPDHDLTWQAEILLDKLNLSVEELFQSIKNDTAGTDIQVEVAESIQE